MLRNSITAIRGLMDVFICIYMYHWCTLAYLFPEFFGASFLFFTGLAFFLVIL